MTAAVSKRVQKLEEEERSKIEKEIEDERVKKETEKKIKNEAYK